MEREQVRPETESEPANARPPDESGGEFERFESFLKRLVRVPKKVLDERRNGNA